MLLFWCHVGLGTSNGSQKLTQRQVLWTGIRQSQMISVYCSTMNRQMLMWILPSCDPFCRTVSLPCLDKEINDVQGKLSKVCRVC